ncbi:hypothetical protein BDZ91DRAFT_413421 [Kalaharituber pfeilii]|nr:hypothetical protein BDZ91DRAFT_413421 [Kalaharituber pfeilii]
MDTEHPQRDRDLLDADSYLTDAQLDSLWDWFCAASHERMDLQFIFVKLVNAARKPYRDTLLTSPALFTPGTSHYTPSECTITENLDLLEAQQQSHSEDKPAAQVVYRALAIAEDSLQTKQTIINQLQDRIMDMDQEQQKFKQKIEEEKRQLELDLATVRSEHEKCDDLTTDITCKLGIINQLSDEVMELNQEQQEFQQKIEDEKRQLGLELATLRAEHDKCQNLTPTYVAIKSDKSNRCFELNNGQLRQAYTVNSFGIFELVQHTNGTVSFISTCFPNTYLSFSESRFKARTTSERIDSTCSTSETFRLHWREDATVKIEPADVPGRFLNIGYPELCYLILVPPALPK